jgi:hypothetical protein
MWIKPNVFIDCCLYSDIPGLTVASLAQLPIINLSQIGNLPQILNLLPVSDTTKQGKR